MNGTPVSCTVIATNAIGSSVPSMASNSVTPTAPAITLLSVKSRKTHGAAGPQDLPITLNVPITGAITIEPRDARRGHTLIFDFATAITALSSVSVTDKDNQPVGLAYPFVSGNTVTVTLIGIPDNRRVSVQLNAVNGIGNNPGVALGFLVGDVNGSQKVNGADIAAIKAKSANTVVNGSIFLLDLNQSGMIDSTDVMMVKARAGWVIP
jgi:hypothetical protein